MSEERAREPAGDPLLVRLLCGWTRVAARHARTTCVLTVLLTVPLGGFAAARLGFNVDPNALFSDELRFQRMIRTFQRYFPVLTDSLLIVVDGATPEGTRAAQLALADALAPQRDVFHRVFLPGEEPFFERTALLYLSVDELEDFADHMATLQPVLGELSEDPSLPTLARLIRLGLEDGDAAAVDPARWEAVLNHFRSATVSVLDEFPVAVSWESVLLADSALDPTTLRVIVADPVLDLERVLAADTAIEAVRAAVRELGLDEPGGVRVRITGYPALNHEEMVGLATDTGLAGTLSFLLVVATLARAFRSLRLVAAAAITLLIGLVWSAAFAGATVAELNPLSIAFGVLVIGLGVDFMIHLGMHVVAQLRAGHSVEGALQGAVRETGAALVLCAATTAVGFLAFLPTEYRGVSDLGLIASGGIVAILFQTLTLFPALIVLVVPEAARARLATVPEPRALRLPTLPAAAVCLVALAIGAAALPLLPTIDLDTNVIRMRNPATPSVRAFEDLLESETATPWYLDALAPSLDEAERLAERIRALPVVDRVVTLRDFVPQEQEEKLDILRDVAMWLDLPSVGPRPEPSVEEQIAALTSLRDFLATGPVAESDAPLGRSAQRLHDALDAFLARVGREREAAFADLHQVLIAPLPDQLERLRTALAVEAIDRDDLPPGLVSRMLAADGHARLQVYPAEDIEDHAAMVRFVEAIRPLWKDITGLPVNLVESARVTWRSLRGAMLWALVAITALLLVLWRRLGDTLIALGPLLLAVTLTMASTAVLPISFNFINVIVLPLILGIGIDSGVHLVHRAARLTGPPRDLLSTTTARAVFYSAVTTVASFGTLALSGHRGIASLGVLLVVGMLWTLAANLLLVPALLELRWRAARGRAVVPGTVGGVAD